MGYALSSLRRALTVLVSVIFGLAALVVAASPAAAAASECDAAAGNLVQNCGFELDTPRALGNLPDWTISGTGTAGDLTVGHSGTHAASLSGNQGTGEPVSISQTVPTVAGAAYTFTYWLEGGPDVGGIPDWSASVSGAVGGTMTFDVVEPTVNVWTQYTHTVTASGSSLTISFKTGGVFTLNNVDDVNVVEVPDVSQSITFGPGPTGPVIPGDTYTVTATGGASGNPVVFSTTNVLRCGVTSAGLVTFRAPGECFIEANQAGGNGYSPAPTAQLGIRVLRTPQLIVITSTAPSHAVPGTPYTITTNGGGPSGLPVTFSTVTTHVCAVDATTGSITFLAPGGCTIQAHQAGNKTYAPAATARQTTHVYAH